MDDTLGTEGTVEAGPAEIGEAGSEAIEQFDEVEQPSRQYVEVDDPDNRFVRVKVDGEDVEVPFSEAVRGYSREAHFTRNMQDLAQQRQEAEYGLNLQRALESNPEMTIRILQERYGVQGAAQIVQQATEEPEYTDPFERALAEEREARLALERRLEQRDVDERLNQTLAGLRQQFNASDDDIQEVVNIAYQMGASVDQLPYLYKAMTFDKINARVQAQRIEEQRRAADTQQRQAAAASANQVISTGTVGSNGITSQAAADGHMTIRQAVEAALAEHGL